MSRKKSAAGAPDSTDAQRSEPPASENTIIRVTSARANFRRAGRAWSLGVTELMPDALTAEQIEILEADPDFTVEIVGEGSAS